MMRKQKLIKYHKSILLFLCVILIILSEILSVPSVLASDEYRESKIIVSLGDSYSSGEGIDPFYGANKPFSEKVKNLDWLSHRSENAWSGMLTLPSVGKMSDHRDENWYFVAMSGAITANIWDREPVTKKNKDYRTIKYKKDNISGEVEVEAQLNIFDKLESENTKADYVTITIGGNDAGFADIVANAFIGSTANNFIHHPVVRGISHASNFIDVNLVHNQMNTVWKKYYKKGGIRDNLQKTYKEIASSAGSQAHIIVVGYPLLFSTTSTKIDPNQAKEINDNIVKFNQAIQKVVGECEGEGINISFVSVEKKFETHEAYSEWAWINKIELDKRDEDITDSGFGSAYSMHPNIYGAEAYAQCVQEEIDRLEKIKHNQQNNNIGKISEDILGERDVVLVLDNSGSMSGTPLEETKKAANKFIDTVIGENVNIGIVKYSDRAEQINAFTNNAGVLKTGIGKLSASGSTNIEDGLNVAENMLSSSSAKKKIIILMSDGLPNKGKSGEELIAYADELKKKDIYIYTLGFFSSVSDKSEPQRLMEKIANEGCHYEVADADNLIYFFGDIADHINGQKFIYVRIACPVDVKVSFNGETLDSSEKNLNTRTSFGSLTFEESDTQAESNNSITDIYADTETKKDTVKILRLKDGTDYDISIDGNGKGKMNYTIGFMDEDGEYSDFRKFKNVNITKRTHIDTVAEISDKTVLNVDEDGDGKYDFTYVALANGHGELIDNSIFIYTIIGLVSVIVVLIIILVIIIKIRKNKKQVTTIKCSKCNTKNKIGMNFCKKCGNRLPKQNSQDNQKNEKPYKKAVKIIVILMIVDLLAIGSCIFLFIYKNNPQLFTPNKTIDKEDIEETTLVSDIKTEDITEIPTKETSTQTQPTQVTELSTSQTMPTQATEATFRTTVTQATEAAYAVETEVPDVVGLSQSDAESKLKNMGLTVEIEETENSSVPKGYVISQYPMNGKFVKKGQNVKLYVSKGTDNTSTNNNSSVSSKPYFNSVTASSVLKESYNAKNLTKNDGNCWCEGVDGNCKWEYILFASSSYQSVSGVEMVNGFSKSTELFNINGRVTKLRFEFSDGTYVDKSISDTMSLQQISFGKTVSTNQLKVYILDYKNGSKYSDICISYMNPY